LTGIRTGLHHRPILSPTNMHWRAKRDPKAYVVSLSSPFYGRECRWAMLGEFKPKGPKGDARIVCSPARNSRIVGPNEPARIPPQLHCSFERGILIEPFLLLSCPAKFRTSNQLVCFQPSIGTKLKGRVIVKPVPNSALPKSQKWLQYPSSYANWAGLPPADCLITFVGSWKAPLVDPEL